MLLSACGSDGSSKASTPDTTPTTAATTTTTSSVTGTAPNTPEQLAADKELARAAVLRPADVPAGFTAEKDEPGDDSGSGDDLPPGVLQTFSDCAHLSPQDAKTFLNGEPTPDMPTVDSPTFERSGGIAVQQTIDSSVVVARRPEKVARVIHIVGAPEAEQCWRSVFEAAFASDAGSAPDPGFSDLTIDTAPVPDLGDEAAVLHGHLTIESSGISLPVWLDMYFARQGRAGASLFAAGISSRVDEIVELALLRKMLDRLDDGS